MDVVLYSGHLLIFLTEMPKNRKPKSDLSLSWLLFLVPFLLAQYEIPKSKCIVGMSIASALSILLFIESHL